MIFVKCRLVHITAAPPLIMQLCYIPASMLQRVIKSQKGHRIFNKRYTEL